MPEIPNENEIRSFLDRSLLRLINDDSYLFTTNNSERCISARLAHHLQIELPFWAVDVEYNRSDTRLDPKLLQLDVSCGNRRDLENRVYVVPDLIVHQRGPDGPNLLIAEVKKTTNRTSRRCDQLRIERFRSEYNYFYGAVIELETRDNCSPTAYIAHWFN